MKPLTHEVIEAEAEFLKRQAGPYIAEVRRLKKGASRAIRGKKGAVALSALVQYAAGEGFSCGSETFFCDMLDRRRGICYPMSAFYVILGNELDLPIHYAEAPEHVFVRWVGGKIANLETTRSEIVRDTYYTNPKNGFFSRLGMHPRSAETGAYMTTKGPSQFLSVTLSQRAFSQLKRKKYDSAFADCQRALEINPVKITAMNNLGLVNIALERYEEAAALFGRILELDPHAATAYSSLGVIYNRFGDHTKALESYGRSVDIDPENPLPYFGQAKTNLRVGSYGRAAVDVCRGTRKAAIAVSKAIKAKIKNR